MDSFSVYRTILEKLLFPLGQGGLVLLARIPKPVSEREFRSEVLKEVPFELFPEGCTIERLSPDEAFLDEAKELVSHHKPRAIFILPPWIDSRSVSDSWSSRYPRENFGVVVVRELLDSVPEGTKLVSLLPQTHLSDRRSREFRKYLVENHQIDAIIEHDHPPLFIGMPFIAHFVRMCTLMIVQGPNSDRSTRFIRYDEIAMRVPSDLLRSVAQLLAKSTTHNSIGYVHEGDLTEDYELFYDLYHPSRFSQLEELKSHFGNVRFLAELVDYVPTLNRTRDASLLSAGEDSVGRDSVPLVSGRDILASGEIASEEARYWIRPDHLEERFLLQAGDICLRAIHLTDTDPIQHIAEVQEPNLPLAADQTVIALRPKSDLDADDREVLRSFLRTRHFTDQLRALGVNLHLSRHYLNRIQVPSPSPSVKAALEELREAELTHMRWANETISVRQALFSIPDTQHASVQIHSTARRVRQRFQAAQSIDDFATRVRTRFPHPIAYKWKIIETSYPNYEGYKHILECGEVTVAYLASISLALAKEYGQDVRIVANEAQKLGEGKSNGKTFGYWRQVLSSAQEKLTAANANPGILDMIRFPDVSSDPAINDGGRSALEYLYEARNADAHGEGPKGFEVESAYHNAAEQLKSLLLCAEFLTEFPLLLIENTRRDTHNGVTWYDFRELMGDHHLVRIQQDNCINSCELEAGSLYLADRAGRMHLLRPVLLHHQASRSDRAATFYLNRYFPDDDISELRSLELGDTIELSGMSSQFKEYGLIRLKP